jgi:hypothetical protein
VTTPVLIGVSGICGGEHFVLELGVAAAVGRSSACEICLQRVPRFLAMSEEQRAKLLDFNVISRRHLTITVNGSLARLENHSGSGTWCDDARFDKAKEVDLAGGPVTLRLGPVETFQLMLLDAAGLDRLSARTTPIQLTTTRVGKHDDGVPTAQRPVIRT